MWWLGTKVSRAAKIEVALDRVQEALSTLQGLAPGPESRMQLSPLLRPRRGR